MTREVVKFVFQLMYLGCYLRGYVVHRLVYKYNKHTKAVLEIRIRNFLLVVFEDSILYRIFIIATVPLNMYRNFG